MNIELIQIPNKLKVKLKKWYEWSKFLESPLSAWRLWWVQICVYKLKVNQIILDVKAIGSAL